MQTTISPPSPSVPSTMPVVDRATKFEQRAGDDTEDVEIIDAETGQPIEEFGGDF